MYPTRILTAALATAVAAGAALAQQPVQPSPGAPSKTAPVLASQAPAPVAPFDATVARRMTADDVKKRIDAGEKITIIDTRSKFSGPMVKGAELVPTDRVAEWSRNLPKDTFILAYCT